MKNVLIYHGNCMDGFAAHWVARLKHLTDLRGLEDFIPISRTYTQPKYEADKDSEITFIDFCFKPDVMQWYIDTYPSVTILDHHQTAIDRCGNLNFTHKVFDMNKSGCKLAWEYYFPNTPTPRLIEYIEDRDIGRNILPDTVAYNTYIESLPFTIEAYNILQVTNPKDIIASGKEINRYQLREVDYICKNTIVLNLYNTYVSLANTSILFNQVGSKLANEFGIGGSYYYNGNRVVFSLRSIEEAKVTAKEIAEYYGGGGHKHAAGFDLSLDKFIDILNGN